MEVEVPLYRYKCSIRTCGAISHIYQLKNGSTISLPSKLPPNGHEVNPYVQYPRPLDNDSFPDFADLEDYWEPEKVVAHKDLRDGTTQYLIRWKDWYGIISFCMHV
jgi:hypothetical protein